MVRHAIVAGLTLTFGFAPAIAEARDRYGAYPAVRVSPDLADEWLLQLSPGSGVVPGYERPHLGRARQNHEQSRRRSHDRQAVAVVRQANVGTPRRLTRTDAVDPMYLPQTVDYRANHKPGTIVIDTNAKFLYLVGNDGTARRYGVGVGKPGFEWAGAHRVTQKREWPTWTPPAQMRAREKKKGRILPVRMEGGPDNPLGARALYLGSTLYRIHGTNQPWSIGMAVSSGCIRMRNEDVTDLYERVGVGTRVVVL